MKDERSKKLYDGITHIDDDLIEAAQADTPVRRTRPWVKWAALAACLVIVAVSALTLWPGRSPALEPQQKPGIQEPGNPTEPMKPTEPSSPSEPGELSGPVMVPDGKDDPNIEIVPMIEAFGKSTYSGDMAVANGGCVYSNSLEAAMRAYGDTVRYRVMIELFRDGVQIDPAGEIAMHEYDKLTDAGYISGLETYNDGSAQHHYFTIHATAEQLRNYPLDKKLGYSFLLYGEYFGETYAGAPTAFSGVDNSP